VLQTLRQPRYVALSAVMLLVATICIGLGTWQISRLAGKHRANNELRRNDHASVARVGDVLPVYGTQSPPRADDIQFRLVTMTGTYEASGQGLVRQRTVDDDVGYLVLTPLRTSTAMVLVVRGFISSGGRTAGVTAPPPPSGTHTIVGRVMPAETASDKAAQLPAGQINSINAGEQSSRLGEQVYDGYVELSAGQPGAQGLVAIPEPDLSNPAGGAAEPQHLAYVIQWYLFAALALAAPIVMARAERRRVSAELDDEALPITPADAKAARLADRYGRPAH
jgi:cytochrome oxidase assembly protein ShyY1